MRVLLCYETVLEGGSEGCCVWGGGALLQNVHVVQYLQLAVYVSRRSPAVLPLFEQKKSLMKCEQFTVTSAPSNLSRGGKNAAAWPISVLLHIWQLYSET